MFLVFHLREIYIVKLIIWYLKSNCGVVEKCELNFNDLPNSELNLVPF